MTTSFKTTFSPGTIIVGKWRRSRYYIHRMLGQGANGMVYLVQKVGTRQLYALKMGYETVDLQSEINVLHSLQGQKHYKTSRKQGHDQHASSFLVEVDDFTSDNKEIPFYVMRYVKGVPIHAFLEKKEREWLGFVGLSLLEKLQQLHDGGWVFGDLKPDNVLVSEYGHVELIDYGGVSSIGRSIKQFTERYDRGYWNAGSRTADEGYDLFSFALLCLNLLYDEGFKKVTNQQLPQARSTQDLLGLLGHPNVHPYAKWLRKAILHEFADTTEAITSWKRDVYPAAVKLKSKQTHVTPRWLKSAFAFSIIMLCCAIYFVVRF
ncbi:serine/threonine protein kinase [Paenibacillus sediminis]|uniref:non-specific serine/threonine protein kinase n=1 Tax=Paenibacillus sediminis TaxID=664909 RepID=A0ABS4H8R0_9BACL|nr:serine/threonine-protein kinase [Paenibacillus sediminis]